MSQSCFSIKVIFTWLSTKWNHYYSKELLSFYLCDFFLLFRWVDSQDFLLVSPTANHISRMEYTNYLSICLKSHQSLFIIWTCIILNLLNSCCHPFFFSQLPQAVLITTGNRADRKLNLAHVSFCLGEHYFNVRFT